jgi:hypothetical protein
MAEKEKAEIAVLAAYLPAALSAEELTALVKDAIAETGASLGTPGGVGKAQMGAVMKAAQAKAAGRADGGRAAAVRARRRVRLLRAGLRRGGPARRIVAAQVSGDVRGPRPCVAGAP